MTKYVDMVFVDRSFGNLHDVVETKFFGKIGVALLQFTTGGWRATNDFDYINTVRDKKYGSKSE